jgi:plastocyanin
MRFSAAVLCCGIATGLAIAGVACDTDNDDDLGAEFMTPLVTPIDATGDGAVPDTPVAGAPRLTPDEGGSGGEGEADPTPFPDDAVVIEVEEVAETQFEPDEFTVGAGEEVNLVLVNNVPITHNLHVFDGDDGDAPTIVETELILGPGEVASETFTAPSEPGEYFFWCDVHATNMTGTMTVE